MIGDAATAETVDVTAAPAVERISASNVVAGSISKYCFFACTVAIGAFLMPFSIRHLGASRYGLWMLVTTLTGYLQLLDAGYGNGLIRHLVAADARRDIGRMNRLISTFFCVYSAIGGVAIVAACLLALFVFPRFPRLAPEDVRTAQWIALIVVVRMAVGFPMTVFGAVSFARMGFVRNTMIATAVSIVTGIVTVVVLTSGYGLLPLVAATTAVNLLAYLAYAQTAFKLFPELKISASLFSRLDWREVTTFSAYLFVIDVAVQVGFNIDNLVIGAALGTVPVAIYSVALRLSEYQRRACDQFSDFVFAFASSLSDRGDRARIRATVIEGTRIATVLAVGGTLGLVAFGPPLVRAWMGVGFDQAYEAVIILACATGIVVAHAPLMNVLLATGHHRLTASVWAGEAIANILLSTFLVRRYQLTGVAIGTLIPVIVGHFGVLLPMAARTIGVRSRDILLSSFAPALIALLPAAWLCVLLRSWSITGSLLTIVAYAVPIALGYAVTLVWVGLRAETRNAYLGHFRRWRASRGSGTRRNNAVICESSSSLSPPTIRP